MRRFIVILIALLAITSCKSVDSTEKTETIIEKEVPIYNTKIEYRDRILHDSIYVRDSSFTLIKNDTVYRYLEKNCIKYIHQIDTILRVDSIPVPVEIKENKSTTTTIKEKEDVPFIWKFIIWCTILLICYKLFKSYFK